jgi:hypothetical protein
LDDHFIGDDPLTFQPGDATGLVGGPALSRLRLLDGRALLRDLRLQQRRIETDERLAAPHPVADIGQHALDAITDQLGAHRRLLARAERARRADRAAERAHLNGRHAHAARGGGRGGRGLAGVRLVGAGGQRRSHGGGKQQGSDHRFVP